MENVNDKINSLELCKFEHILKSQGLRVKKLILCPRYIFCILNN